MASFYTMTSTISTTTATAMTCQKTETSSEHTNAAAGSCLICGSRVHQTRNCPVSPRK